MTVAAGDRLGPYEILAPLGVGGMGAVFRARDTRLDRIVAIKVVRPSLSAAPEFKARFTREAKAISVLNHPHICTLHDVGEEADIAYLVMEHLDGETLAARLRRGPLPIAEALPLAIQMADALDKAHRQGIVHRDLKPANVFLLRGAAGRPHCKLLDFGLAKMGVTAGSGPCETQMATTPPAEAETPLTAQGTILGTFQYMAPEQIEGADADARADIWAFGCVLYEMLTGQRAFDGQSQASLVASILERQPTPLAELQPMTPPALGRLVRTCLEKDPDNRFHAAHDVWLHLQWIEEGGSAAGLPGPVVARRRRRHLAVTAAMALAIGGASAAAAWWLKPAPAITNVVMRSAYPLPEGQQFTRTGRRVVAISPDGTRLAYIANRQIHLRQLDELEARPVRGTDLDPMDVTFSPDGLSLAFFAPAQATGDFAGATLQRIAVSGGTAVTVSVAGVPYGARWQGNRIVFSLGDRIMVVPDTGGTPETVASVAEGSGDLLAQPQFVGDGRTLLYTLRTRDGSFDEAQIMVQAPGGERRVLVEGGTDGRVTPTGHLVWVRNETLFAQRINPGTLVLAGGPVPLIEGVDQPNNSGAGQLALSDTGTLLMAPKAAAGTATLQWVNRDGGTEDVGLPAGDYRSPRLSPDGTKIAIGMRATETNHDLWIWDVTRRTMTQLTSNPGIAAFPVWSPDSTSIFFAFVPPGGTGGLYRRNADGTGSVERLSDTTSWHMPLMVLPDGNRVLVGEQDATRRLVLWPTRPGGEAQPLFAAYGLSAGAVSPDGRWIAYGSPEGSGREEIHVRPFPDTENGHWQISAGGGSLPMWSRSGRELFYVSPNPSRLTRVEVFPARADGPFVHGPRSDVLDLRSYSASTFFRPGWDISLDDRRFLLLVPVRGEKPVSGSLTIVTHWFDELRARVK